MKRMYIFYLVFCFAVIFNAFSLNKGTFKSTPVYSSQNLIFLYTAGIVIIYSFLSKVKDKNLKIFLRIFGLYYLFSYIGQPISKFYWGILIYYFYLIIDIIFISIIIFNIFNIIKHYKREKIRSL